MRVLSYSIICVLLGCLTACDQDTFKKPMTEARTIIIAGVPVYDRDYKLSPHETAYNEPRSDDDF